MVMVQLTSQSCPTVSAGSPSRGGDVAVHVFYINQPSLPTPFYSVLVPVSVFMALSTVFLFLSSPDNSPFSHSCSSGLISVLSTVCHAINSSDNSLFSHSVFPVLFLPYWTFELHISM